jgi:hypothetical protein
MEGDTMRFKWWHRRKAASTAASARRALVKELDSEARSLRAYRPSGLSTLLLSDFKQAAREAQELAEYVQRLNDWQLYEIPAWHAAGQFPPLSTGAKSLLWKPWAGKFDVEAKFDALLKALRYDLSNADSD